MGMKDRTPIISLSSSQVIELFFDVGSASYVALGAYTSCTNLVLPCCSEYEMDVAK